MACIKSVSRSASVAFSPDSPYLAAGTMAGAVDISFSSTANLEIFKLDFQSSDQELPIVGECPSTERFNRLSWGKTGSGTEEFSLGLIAGGLVDGGINIWNPLTLIREKAALVGRQSSEENEKALVVRLTKHTGPVRGLDFNPHSPNLLASGADEGEICIWDLANPTEPTHFPSLKSVGSGAQGEVSFLAWNRKIQHILASTSYNGSTVVWDLKRQKPVISFADPDRRRRCSVLQWNPDLPTHLIVASDDDNSPALRLWDLRSMVAPVKEFVGHTKGVIAMSWCPMDSSLLLTCGKDNRTICWDTVSGEIVSEFTEATSWNFDIQWYPKSPGLVSASSFDGKIGIYNVEGCSKLAAGEGQFGAVNMRAPKWMKCPVGAAFGFGGKLVSFNPSISAASTPTGNSEVYLHSLVTEPSLVSRSTEFETAMQDGDKSSLRVLCEKKSEEAKSEDDRETWGFLKVMFEDDGTARTKLLTHLGFSVHDEKVEENLSEEINALGLDESITNETESTQDKTLSPTDNGEDFFNNLQSPKADPSLLSSVDNFTDQLGSVPSEEQMQQELDGQGEASSLDDSIRRALVVGDYKGAVSQCISANRMADALVIANLGGASLWESARDQYLKKSYSSYLKVVAAMVNNDLMSLVNTRPLDSWKETLALLCNFADKEWTVLCDSLASRLMAVGNTLAATLCYICAGNVEKTVEIWSRSLKPEHDGRTYVDLLQDLMEKTIILALATGQKRFSASLSKLVENYAELLASQGLLTTAMEYLKLLGSEESSQELAILQDRIALSAEENGAPKHSPFEHAQPQNESVYGADQPGFDMNSGSQQHYYQPQQHQTTAAAAPYAENYQQQYGASYGGAYATPTPYQPGPPTPYQPGSSTPYQPGSSTPYQPAPSTPYQPAPSTPYQPGPSTPYQPGPTQMFVPSPEPQVSQPNFPPSVVTQHKTFVPTDLPALRNAQQYQQPSLGSQLYPGASNNAYQNAPLASGSLGSGPSQMGPVPGHSLSQIAAPAPMSRAFMPVNNPGFAPKPGMGPMQPPSPTQATQAAPATPAAPPPTIQTADTSKVPAQQKPVIATLNRLFKETSEALGGSRANPAKKREIEDNSRKMGALFAKLNSEDISKNAADKLVQLCQALDAGDFGTALQIQVLLTTSEWDECNFWLAALKRMIKTKQNVRLNERVL